jgi:hypothetical protein
MKKNESMEMKEEDQTTNLVQTGMKNDGPEAPTINAGKNCSKWKKTPSERGK